ncbi:MAG: energy transducer TonB [Pseudomonadota bacterium]
MLRRFEFPGFVALAAGAHLALFLSLPEGPEGDAGAGGEASLSLAALSGDLEALVEAFENPPEVALDLPDPMEQPDAPDTPPDMVTPELAALPEMLERPDVQMPDAPDTPMSVDAAPPEPMALRQPEPSDIAPPPDMPQLNTPVPLALPIPSAPAPAAPPPPELAMRMPPPPAPAPIASPAAPAPPPPPPPPEPQPPEPNIAPEDMPDAAKTPPPRRPERKPQVQEPVRTAQPKAAPPPPQAEQRAKGSGAASSAGAGKQADVATLAPGARDRLMNRWGGKIRARVERRKPRGTRDKGTAIVRLVVSADGQLVGLSLARSSGVQTIDEAALNAVRRAGRFPKAPKDLGTGRHTFTLPIKFGR